MLHIILGILKGIGILLAAVILLLLLIFLVLLFVPVRYKGTVTKTSEIIAAQIRVTWFFHLILVMLSYDHRERRPVFEIRIFGMTIPTLKKIFSGIFAVIKKFFTGIKRFFAGVRRILGKVRSESRGGKEKRPAAEEEFPAYDLTEEEDADGYDSGEKSIDVQDSLEDHTAWPGNRESEDAKMDKAEESTAGQFDDTKDLSLSEKLENLQYKLIWICDTIKQKVKAFLETVKKIVHLVQNLLKNIGQVVQKLLKIPEKMSEFQEFLEKYEIKAVIDIIWCEVKHLLRHYGPRRIEGYLRFGTGDPAVTGQLLGGLYIILPVKAWKFSLQPEFTEAVFETDVRVSGHVRANHMVAVIWRLFRNKELMSKIKMLKKERRK